ncbi:hypothetical protein [Anaeromyxobacter sp. Fw109-5]|uniref:hypothetical protein n=1 Tax=Anaeromyxobacter sp. (strain Fw109-5) TaxID=404589 RepID=UPI0003081857|nr:hypothetical protein [Anaeromyxobacter sp. Fw109-5]
MAKSASDGTVTLRIRCCQCGRVDRFVAPASEAFRVADELLNAPCRGVVGRSRRCASRDRRLDLRAAAPGHRHGAALPPG